MYSKKLLFLILGLMLILTTQTISHQENKHEAEIIHTDEPNDTTWFIFLDGEIVYTIFVGKDIKLGLSDQYIAFYGDFIFSNGFEEVTDTKERSAIQEYQNNQ